VSWLDGGGDEGGEGPRERASANDEAAGASLKKLRDGLNLAARRTDELALRRVWGRLSEMPFVERRRVRPFVIGGVCLVARSGLATVFVLSLRVAELAAPPPRVAAAASAPEVDVVDLVPVLLGPARLETGARESKRVRLKGGALVGVAAETTLMVDAGQRPAVTKGRVSLQVPRQPPGEQFTVEAGPYMIVVVGTKFDVDMGARQLEVSVQEGVVEVWRDGKMVRLKAGNSWRGPVGEPTARTSRARRVAASGSAFRQHPGDRFEQAKLALATGDAAGALEILRDLAAGSGPIAENSGYEIGLVLRDRQQEPRAAIEAWRRYRERFPRGLLRAEADLSIVETALELGERNAALLEAEAFLRRHPRSERRAEVEALVRRLARASAPQTLVQLP
jgi:FecR protein